ncbi:MAG TPA: flagellar motor switch protein FliN [Firmicutes bacterium]|nr:flagellar motor switch protein FliN [Candidatus Fermentithermobacillaceae bacterium]
MNEQLSQEQIDALLLEAARGESLDEPSEKPSAAKVRENPQARTKDVPEAKTSAKADDKPAEALPGRPEPSVQPVFFEEFSKEPETEAPVAGMEALLDVPLSVSVELGRAKCRVKDLLNLTVGAVLELDKSAGENVDVLVNGKLFAHGEVVVVDENFGVRITDIVSKKAVDRGVKKDM